MAVDLPPADEENLQVSERTGTLAIDLGSTTTVVAFQLDGGTAPNLLDLPPITRNPGEIPSLIWARSADDPNPLVGRQVLDSGLADGHSPGLLRDFKRFIAGPELDPANECSDQSNGESLGEQMSADSAGEWLLREIWRRLPNGVRVGRLVLTAPVEHYRGYRTWLLKACSQLPVDEIALVDEPTAAALGAGLAPGSRLLVVDVGGSTIDMALVALEGGEGRAAPLAQLLRFRGRDLASSRQSLRCAKVLGKAGLALGGRDLDRWIVDHLAPGKFQKDDPAIAPLLNAAERLKCRLSDCNHPADLALSEIATLSDEGRQQELRLTRLQLESLIQERGLLKALDDLLEQTLAGGRRHGCPLEDLDGVMAVGGGARLPLLLDWLRQRTAPVRLLTPPPVVAVASGALSLTPGVQVRDVLQRGVSLRCWDRRSQSHHWHPLFVAGQTWPTRSPLELVLAAGREGQGQLELVLGEPEAIGRHDVVYVNGLPTLQQGSATATVRPWSAPSPHLPLEPTGKAGQDCLRLRFSIDAQSVLLVEGEDLRSGLKLQPRELGTVR